MTAAPPLLALHDLVVRLAGRTILQGLNGTLSGNVVGLLGPNGAGKTTLLNTLLGFYTPHAGTLEVLGLDVRRELDGVRSLLGYMPETESYIGNLSAVRFVRLMAELSGLPPDAALERAHEALFYVGLGEARYRKLDTYSLGMRQLAKLAQAIAHGPKVLLLDEPTNGLDPPARHRMLELVRDIASTGVRVLVASHLLRDVEEVCDEVIVLREGRVATIADLRAAVGAGAENQRFLEIETEGGADDLFTSQLAELGCVTARLANQRLKVVLPEGVETRALYRLAGEHGVQLRRLTTHRDSLEQVFLRAMESSGGADARV